MGLNTGQSVALEEIENGNNLFISGPGGVGKSFLINYIRELYEDSTIFLAPTGIAALNILGSTIHSTFRFPMHVLTEYNQRNPNSNLESIFDVDGPVKRICLDEISMARGDIFVTMDQNLRRIRRRNQPFGGIQIIAVGDFYQLPPVVGRDEKYIYKKLYNSPYAFGNETWSAADFKYIELTEIMRQTDEVFISHLQNIRQRTKGFQKSLDFFNSNAIPNARKLYEDDLDPVLMCATNKVADTYNSEKYDNLDGEESIHMAHITGRFDTKPAPRKLCLKYGTKLVITKNIPEKGIMNGEICYFEKISGGSIKIILESDEREVYLSKFIWEQKDYIIDNKTKKLSTNTVGKYEQFPVRYGWALTVHKCQGTSLNYALIDSGWGFFAHGQAYVALSRLKTLEGMGLNKKLKSSDIIVDKEVIEFYQNGCRGIGL